MKLTKIGITPNSLQEASSNKVAELNTISGELSNLVHRIATMYGAGQYASPESHQQAEQQMPDHVKQLFSHLKAAQASAMTATAVTRRMERPDTARPVASSPADWYNQSASGNRYTGD